MELHIDTSEVSMNYSKLLNCKDVAAASLSARNRQRTSDKVEVRVRILVRIITKINFLTVLEHIALSFLGNFLFSSNERFEKVFSNSEKIKVSIFRIKNTHM